MSNSVLFALLALLSFTLILRLLWIRRSARAGLAAEQALRYFHGTKDIRNEGLFRSVMLRWGWRIYSQRFTQAGRWFLWPSLIFLGYGAASLELQGYIPLCYAAALWAVALAALPVARPRVELRAWHASRVCAGEALPVELAVEQRGQLTGAGLTILPHRLPPEIDVLPEEGVALPPLELGQASQARLSLLCKRRGVYTLRGFRVESDFPFGLLRAHQRVEEERQVLVYPQFFRLARFDLPSGRRYQPGGVALASHIGESFEYVGNREYRDGDNVRDIDWRSTARLNRPIVREYREEYFLRVAVILDTHVPAPVPWHWRRALARRPAPAAESSGDFERAVSVCAAVSDFMSRQEYLVDIFAAGPNLYHLTAGRSLACLDQILDILACVDANPEEPFAAIEPELHEHLDSVTSVICVFLDWNKPRQEFVYKLRQHGAGLKILVVRDTPCTLDPAEDAGLLGPIPVVSRKQFEAGIEEL